MSLPLEWITSNSEFFDGLPRGKPFGSVADSGFVSIWTFGRSNEVPLADQTEIRDPSTSRVPMDDSTEAHDFGQAYPGVSSSVDGTHLPMVITVIVGTDRANHLTGTDGPDIMTGGAGGDTLVGGAGDDTLYGAGGREGKRATKSPIV
jgi:Ca2+-binding RTX toxin-like protein